MNEYIHTAVRTGYFTYDFTAEPGRLVTKTCRVNMLTHILGMNVAMFAQFSFLLVQLPYLPRREQCPAYMFTNKKYKAHT